MPTIEIEAKEQELIREIDSDASLLDSVLKFIRQLKKTQGKSPCQYTADELKVRLNSCKTQST